MKVDTKIIAIPPKLGDTDIRSGREKRSFDVANPVSKVDELILSNKYTNLTDEQINCLKEKYDVEHIGDQQLGNLLDELVNMGAMDGKYKLFAYEATPVSYSGSGLQFSSESKPPSEMENRQSDGGNLLKRMNQKLEQFKANIYSSPEIDGLISHFINILNLIKR